MGAPSSEVGYTSATTGRGDHEVHKGMWWHWEKKTLKVKVIIEQATKSQRWSIGIDLLFL
jgi:hypothetical protein